MMFVFVTPSCERKLKTLTEATGILDESQRSKSCSLIVMFLESLPVTSISRLVHVFWNIGQKSLFGPLFNEVDQQGALQLLSNIKPHIMERVSNRVREVQEQVTTESTYAVNGKTSTQSKPLHSRKSSRPQRIERMGENIVIDEPLSLVTVDRNTPSVICEATTSCSAKKDTTSNVIEEEKITEQNTLRVLLDNNRVTEEALGYV